MSDWSIGNVPLSHKLLLASYPVPISKICHQLTYTITDHSNTWLPRMMGCDSVHKREQKFLLKKPKNYF